MNVQKINIRLALKSDLETLAKLDQQTSLTSWSDTNYLSSFNNPQHHIYALVKQQETIGTIVISISGFEAEILQLWIKQPQQNHGYATLLIKDTIDKLKKQNIKQLFLEVRSDNMVAINLYKKLGFTQIGIRNNYYKIGSQSFDAIVMLKPFE